MEVMENIPPPVLAEQKLQGAKIQNCNRESARAWSARVFPSFAFASPLFHLFARPSKFQSFLGFARIHPSFLPVLEYPSQEESVSPPASSFLRHSFFLSVGGSEVEERRCGRGPETPGRKRRRRGRGLTRCTSSEPAAPPLPPPQSSLTRSVCQHFRPADVIKVRLQMQLAGQRGNLVGMGTIFTHMVEKEGPRSLYLGLSPALMRSLVYGGLRLGLYEPCKHVCSYAFGSTNFAFKIASGIIAGALATALTNPMEFLKVRLQMSTNSTSAIGEVRKVVAQEGLKALWKGVGPAMARAGCLTAAQVATYDEAKQALLKWTPLEEGFHLHLISSCIAGTAGTLVTAPVDMIKTRLMLQQESKGVRVYRNGFHCAYKVVQTEGVKSLYKGGFANFARLGPQTTITFIVCEKLRELAGMTAI